MKNLTRWALCLALCLTLVVCGALAAESSINVQLNGQNLTFTDAVPQVKDQRTFLPFRAVFEAMGADVDNEGNLITAVRGSKTLTMTIGSTEATVTEQGVSRTVTMDVAPYVDASIWRTYVPVRFAAQAFGCSVGWDQAAQTAIIIDTEKLAEEARAGKTYTYMEKVAALGAKYKEGTWNMEANLDANMTLFFSPISITSTFQGVIQDNAKMDMTMNLMMDIGQLVNMIGGMFGQTPSAEDMSMMDKIKTDGADIALRGDVNTGKLYMNMDLGALNTQMKLDAAAWYELDMATLMEQAGFNWNELMLMSDKKMNYLDTMVSVLSAMEPTSAASDYTAFKTSFDRVFTDLADESFVQKGNTYTATSTVSVGDTPILQETITLEMNGDALTRYTMNTTTYSQDGAERSSTSASMTADGKVSARSETNAGGAAMTMTTDGSYTPGMTAPMVTPPAEAKIIPFTDLMNKGQNGVTQPETVLDLLDMMNGKLQ